MTLSKPSLHLCLCSVILSIAVSSSYAQVTLTPGHEERDVGISLYNQGNVNSAIKALRNAVKKNKLDVEAWYFLGLACSHSKDTKCARKAFEEAVKLNPNFVDARNGLAYNLFKANKLKEAVIEAEASLRIKSRQELAHYVIGAVHLAQNSYSAAAEQADEALKARPDYPPALLLKSQAFSGLFFNELPLNRATAKTKEAMEADEQKRLGYMKEAAAALERYISLRPDDPDISTWREQMETLRAYSTYAPLDAEVLGGRDVTTRARVTRKPEPQYTDAARSNGVTGSVVLRAIFAADGTVRDIRVVKRLPYGLTERAVAAARQIKFKPATKNGLPVSMYVQLEYNFNLY